MGSEGSRARELALPPRPCHRTGMDTSTTPHISPNLEPETLTALMLRYAEDHREIAYQCARALVSTLAADMRFSGAICLARDIVTESTNDIRNFEGEEAGVDLRALLYRFTRPY